MKNKPYSAGYRLVFPILSPAHHRPRRADSCHGARVTNTALTDAPGKSIISTIPRVIGLLFSGQGAQQVGMGKDLSQHHASAANLFSEADRRLQRSISQIALQARRWNLPKRRIVRSRYIHGLALLEVLREELGAFTLSGRSRSFAGEFAA